MISYFQQLYARYQAWTEERRKRRAHETYCKGYRTGMKILATGEETPERLYTYTEFGIFTEWDRGIRDAIVDFKLSGVEKK